MSLFRAETTRLVKRRFTRYLTLTAVLVLLAVAAGLFFTNQKSTPTVVAKAQAQAQVEYQRAVTDVNQQRTECEQAKGTPAADKYPSNCADMTPPPPDAFQAKWYLPSSFDFREQFPAMITVLAGVLAMVAFVIGASFVGAEWNSGGMMNLLLWRPHRLKVLGTKLAALLLGLTVSTLVASLCWTGIVWLVASLRGSTDKLTSGVWQSFGLTGLRGLALVLVAGAIGFGLASLGRHTAMAFGVAIGVGVVLQIGLGTVLNLARVPFYEAYLIPIWGQAWMGKSVILENYDACNVAGFSGDCKPDTLSITWQMSGGVLAAAVVLIVGAALWTMRSRDVT